MYSYPLDTRWLMHPDEFTRMQAVDIVRAMAQMPEEASREFELPLDVIGDTAIIHIKGVMTKDPSFFSFFFGGTSTRLVQKAVELAAGDKDVHTIILKVDSPGGSVDGLAELGDAVFKARESTNIIAQVNGMAASAAYYVASQATKIFAGRMDMIGSIGTRLVVHDFSKAFEEAGVETIVIDTGKFKSIGEPGTEVTEEQQDELQKTVDLFFGDFKAVVARGRKMSMARVNEVADGRTFLATEAKSLGLIDGIQGLDVTMGRLAARQRRSQAQGRLRQAQQAYRLECLAKGQKHDNQASHNPV